MTQNAKGLDWFTERIGKKVKFVASQKRHTYLNNDSHLITDDEDARQCYQREVKDGLGLHTDVASSSTTAQKENIFAGK